MLYNSEISIGSNAEKERMINSFFKKRIKSLFLFTSYLEIP